jgi:hypothetical protein
LYLKSRRNMYEEKKRLLEELDHRLEDLRGYL